MFSYHIYPVLHLLSWKSTLYPSFLLSSFVFFPLRNMLLFYVWSCLKSHLFYPHHLLCSFLMPFVSFLTLFYGWCFYSYCCCGSCSGPFLAFLSGLSVLRSFPSLSVGFTLNLYHPLLYSTCFVVEFVVRSFYLLYFTFCVGQ